jgi:hypothetical protein
MISPCLSPIPSLMFVTVAEVELNRPSPEPPVRPRVTAGKYGKATTAKNARKEAMPAKKAKVMRAPPPRPRRGRFWNF